MLTKFLTGLAIILAPVVSIGNMVYADDEPQVTIAASDSSAAEAGLGTGAFTVARTGPTGGTLTVSYTVSGTATAATDYVTLGGSVVIPSGESSASITVVPVEDILIEGSETVMLTLTADASYTVGTQNSATVAIVDNDAAVVLPEVTVSASDETATEAGPATGAFTVSRTGATAAALTVDYTVGGSASSGSDYTALSGSVVIPAESSSAVITVSPVDDTLVEGSETVVLTLVSEVAYAIGLGGSATVTIADNDENAGLPVVTITATDADAAEKDTDTGAFVVCRSGPTTSALTVHYTTSGAAASGDYVALSGSVVIPDGACSATITLTPVDDELVEGTETVIITLSADTAYTVGTNSSATVTIADDDKDEETEHPGGVKPGWGCGDTNHEHSGPPGRGGEKDSPCDRSGQSGHDSDDDDDDREVNSGRHSHDEDDNDRSGKSGMRSDDHRGKSHKVASDDDDDRSGKSGMRSDDHRGKSHKVASDDVRGQGHGNGNSNGKGKGKR